MDQQNATASNLESVMTVLRELQDELEWLKTQVKTLGEIVLLRHPD